jgi:hypothetical protein
MQIVLQPVVNICGTGHHIIHLSEIYVVRKEGRGSAFRTLTGELNT